MRRAGFDNMILRSLYDTFSQQLPWEWFFDRDMRAILDLRPAAKAVGGFVDVSTTPCMKQAMRPSNWQSHSPCSKA